MKIDNSQKKIIAVLLSASIMMTGIYLSILKPPKNILINASEETNRTFIRSIEFRETINPGTRDERNYTFRYSEYMDADGRPYLEVET